MSEMLSSDFSAIYKKTHGIRVVEDGASVDFFTNKKNNLLDDIKNTLLNTLLCCRK